MFATLCLQLYVKCLWVLSRWCLCS
jgi:hypothetical protein